MLIKIITTTGGKGRTVVLTDRGTCQQKVKIVVQESRFTKIYENPTDFNPKQLQQQYSIYPYMRYVIWFSWTRSHWILYCQRCLYTQPRKYKQLGKCNRRVPLLYAVVITAIWAVLVIICNLEF